MDRFCQCACGCAKPTLYRGVFRKCEDCLWKEHLQVMPQSTIVADAERLQRVPGRDRVEEVVRDRYQE